MKKKVCVFTGSRAEYGLLYWLMKDIEAEPDLTLQLMVSGSHLSLHHGKTIEKIETDGFNIDRVVDLELSEEDGRGDIAAATGKAVIGVAAAIKALAPDLMVLLGDRYELLGAATAALLSGVPIFHLHGGEVTEGAYDDSIRHSISKMARWHGVANDTYRNRVIQMGEQPDSVFTVGGLGLDSVKRMSLLSKPDLESQLGFNFAPRNVLVTYHPVTNDDGSDRGFDNLLRVLEKRDDIGVIFTYPNADPGWRMLVEKMDGFVNRFADRCVCWRSLGQHRYLSTLQYVDGVVGNSSSGIIEAPSFHIGSVNIGERQTGRAKAASVIDSGTAYDDIFCAIETLFDPAFRASITDTVNPYGDGGASKRVLGIIKNLDLPVALSKPFYDIAMPVN